MSQTATTESEAFTGSESARASEAEPSSQVGALIAPVKNVLIIACICKAIGAIAAVVPFIAVVELGRVLLADGSDQAGQAWFIGGVVFVALLVRAVFSMLSGGLTHLADADFQLHLRQRMASRLSRVPLGWFTERNAGEVKKSLQDDVQTLHHLVGHSYTDLVGAIVTPLFTFAYLIWADWRLAIAAGGIVGLGMVLYSFQFRGYKERMADYEEALADVNAASVEFVQGIAVVKTFGQAKKSYGRFIERTDAFVKYFWEWVSSRLGLSAAAEIVFSPLFALVGILAAGLALVSAGLAEPLDVLPFALLAPGLSAPFMTLAYAQHDLMRSRGAAARISALLHTKLLPETVKTQIPANTEAVFKAVGFSYDGETKVLQDIDLTLKPGTVTALVGPSGSGKSTLARLLPRFWDPTEGVITIGGVPLTDIDPEQLYGTVGFVFQDIQLLRSTIRENIALGRPGATQQQIEAVAKAAQIHERILELPDGYDAIVGVDARLSGGEAQRISIARALLADAPILVLDEATAFADPESEAAIQEALSTLIAGRTLLVIAHRLHTIVGADQICVLDKGAIVEHGRHEDLLAQSGLYARLWAASEAALGNRLEESK